MQRGEQGPEAVPADRPDAGADRETPEASVRSSAAAMAARIGGAVHPVTPAKQILITGPDYRAGGLSGELPRSR